MAKRKCNTNRQMSPSEYFTERWLAFWMNVNIPDDPNACWEWTGFIMPSGHGQFFYGTRDIKASRALWIMYYGSLNTEDYICHKCDNPKCVRFDHLYKGTHKSNQFDRRGKSHAPYSLKGWKSEYVRQSKGIESAKSLADFFEVGPSVVHRIWRGLTWRREVPTNG